MRSVSRHDRRRNVATVSKAESSRNTQMSAPEAEASTHVKPPLTGRKLSQWWICCCLGIKGLPMLLSTILHWLVCFWHFLFLFICIISSKVQLNGISSVPSNRNNLSVTPVSTSFSQKRNLNFHLMWKPAVWQNSTKWRNTFFSNIQMNWPSSWKTSSCVLQDS